MLSGRRCTWGSMETGGQVTDWSRAYVQYRPEVVSFLSRRLWGRPELAEDLTQETFARALRARAPLRDPASVRPYLLRIAHRVFLSHVRRGSRVTSESDLGPKVDLASHSDAKAPDPLAVSQATQLRERLDRLVAELPEEQQIAFRRGVLERRPYAEIAAAQGWTVEKVKSCVFRARKTLIPALRDFR